MHKAPAIGIDLGTSYSCVGVFLNGNVEIINNYYGKRITPSYVAFKNSDCCAGKVAKDYLAMNLQDTIFDVKRLIGRSFDDLSVQSDKKNWSFNVVDEDNNPKIQIMGEKNYFPEEISALFLRHMKTIAENYLGQKVKDAVISVPAQFSDSQRQATVHAGTIAGLNVLRIVNEPTAAAILYVLKEKKCPYNRNILVFDLGGGAFDVTVLAIENSILNAKSTAGNCHLGGEDFDYRMVNHFIEEFKIINDKDISLNEKALIRLKVACEIAKCELSTCSQANISIFALHEGIDFFSIISRELFEELNGDLFLNTLIPVQKALMDARLDKSQIEEIILIGGSTRIPKIRQLLKDYFNGKDLNTSLNPDEAVASGAAILAAFLTGDLSESIQNLLLLEANPFQLAIEDKQGSISSLVDKNMFLPNRKRLRNSYSDAGNLPFSGVKIYEISEKKNLIGGIELTGFYRGEEHLDLIFDLDCNGILNVISEKGKINFKKDKGILNQDEFERMVKEVANLNIKC
jgi:heat shock protein 1/8